MLTSSRAGTITCGPARQHSRGARTMTSSAKPSVSALDANLARLAARLAGGAAGALPHLVDGTRLPAVDGRVFENQSPVDGSLICEVARGGAADVDKAAHAATRASARL